MLANIWKYDTAKETIWDEAVEAKYKFNIAIKYKYNHIKCGVLICLS